MREERNMSQLDLSDFLTPGAENKYDYDSIAKLSRGKYSRIYNQLKKVVFGTA